MNKINENIIHDTFGLGQIVDIIGSGDERKLMIHFIESGPKLLLERLVKNKITYTDNIIDIPNVEVEEKYQNNIHSNQLKYSSNSIHPKWAESYARLKNYLEKNANPDYKCPDTGKRYSFYYWLCTQKRLFRNGNLNQDQIDMLNQIVDLNESGLGSRKVRWENNYNLLHAYLKKHNKMFPQYTGGNYKTGKTTKLYRWYYKQRYRFLKNLLSKELSDKFSILIELVNNANNRRTRSDINEQLDKIKQYISEGLLPPSRNKDGSRNKLRVFLDNQINYFRSGKMPSERIDQFKNIGLDLENFRQLYKKRNKIDEEELLDILYDIYLHLKEGKSMSAHEDRYHFYRRSSDKKREGQSDRVKELIDKIKVESNKQKTEKPIIILKRVLEHVKLGEPIYAHPSSSIYYSRVRKYDIQAIEVQKLVAKIKKQLNQNTMDKPKKILTGILNHVKVGEPIYAHPHSAVYYGRQKKKQIQIPEIQELLDKINIFIEANAQIKNPYYILSDILEFVKSGGTVNEHPKSNYYYNRVASEEFLEEDISVLIKEINYYIDLNQFSDAE